MSILFELQITLSTPSRAYQRLGALLVFGVSASLWVYGDLPGWLLLSALGCCVYSGWQFYRRPYPHAKIRYLRYSQHSWEIETWDSSKKTYTHMSIVLDTGLYLFIRLSGGKERWPRGLILFYDQIPPHTWRHLCVLNSMLTRQ